MQKQNNEKRVVIYCRESRDDNGENYERIETQRDLLVKAIYGYDKDGKQLVVYYINRRNKIDFELFKNFRTT